MMNESLIAVKSRRALLKRAARFIGAVAVLPLIETIRSARAEGKMAKADVNYQDKSSAGKDCDDCLHFITGATPGANGTCKVVEGIINPRGHCAAFTRKPTKLG
jgi:hypothetical protein